jgi:hypothetical protein
MSYWPTFSDEAQNHLRYGMTESSPGLPTIAAIERDREASERKLEEIKVTLDALGTKKRALDIEVCSLKKRGWWARLFN